MDSNIKIVLVKTELQRVCGFPFSVLSKSKILDGQLVAARITKKSFKCQKRTFMGQLFLLEIVLDHPLWSQNNWTETTKRERGFIPGIALNWIYSKLISGCLRKVGSTILQFQLLYLLCKHKLVVS